MLGDVRTGDASTREFRRGVRSRARSHSSIHSFIHYSFARALAPCKIYELVHYAIPYNPPTRRARGLDAIRRFLSQTNQQQIVVGVVVRKRHGFAEQSRLFAHVPKRRE